MLQLASDTGMLVLHATLIVKLFLLVFFSKVFLIALHVLAYMAIISC
jgi:hypothetical protein